MNGLDILLILVILTVAGVQMFRGFGRAVFDALFLYAALWAAYTLSFPFAKSVHFVAHGAAINHAWAYGLLLVIFGALGLLISSWVYGMTRFDAGMFEGFLGLLCGLGASIMLCHGLVHVMDMSDPDGKGPGQIVADSAIGHESLNFPGFHSVMDVITGAGTYRRELPSVESMKK